MYNLDDIKKWVGDHLKIDIYFENKDILYGISFYRKSTWRKWDVIYFKSRNILVYIFKGNDKRNIDLEDIFISIPYSKEFKFEKFLDSRKKRFMIYWNEIKNSPYILAEIL